MKHLAIIADGNRRWAASQNLPKEAGHAQGLNVIERCCEWAISRDVKMLTVYCFSTENWGRESGEVDQIMDLARWYFGERREWFVTRGIRVRFAGRRDRLAKDLVEDMETMEEETKQGDVLTLTICADYGGRDAITRAVQHGARTEQELDVALTGEVPTPDAILRTGGEMRLSNFLLWQAAYAELFFSSTMFPALEDVELDALLEEYSTRTRKFGT